MVRGLASSLQFAGRLGRFGLLDILVPQEGIRIRVRCQVWIGIEKRHPGHNCKLRRGSREGRDLWGYYFGLWLDWWRIGS